MSWKYIIIVVLIAVGVYFGIITLQAPVLEIRALNTPEKLYLYQAKTANFEIVRKGNQNITDITIGEFESRGLRFSLDTVIGELTPSSPNKEIGLRILGEVPGIFQGSITVPVYFKRNGIEEKLDIPVEIKSPIEVKIPDVRIVDIGTGIWFDNPINFRAGVEKELIIKVSNFELEKIPVRIYITTTNKNVELYDYPSFQWNKEFSENLNSWYLEHEVDALTTGGKEFRAYIKANLPEPLTADTGTITVYLKSKYENEYGLGTKSISFNVVR